MATTRKDKRGYVLRNGECHRSDGRYSFSYTDRQQKRRCIYAKTLVDLRKREKQILRDIDDGLDPGMADRMTVNQLFDRYISQKYNLKQSTKNAYIYCYDHFIRDTFGQRKMNKVKYTDIKRFYYSLMEEKGLKANTIENIHKQLHPAFQMAVRDELIRKNPAAMVMGEIKKSHIWEKKSRHSLTILQQKALMNFLESNYEYHGWTPIITVLLGTGMRIGECLGLCWQDLDFENRMISVNRNLTYRPEPGIGSVVRINTPKTEAGKRTIPMIDEVYEAFLEEYQIQSCLGFNTNEIDGHSGFIFSTGEGNVYTPESINRAIHRITDAYNETEKKKAQEEKREEVLIPHFSAHSLRHTFCTRLCENESNLKIIQSVMGHADIATTLDVYAEATVEKKQEVFANLKNKIIIK